MNKLCIFAKRKIKHYDTGLYDCQDGLKLEKFF